MKKKRFSLCHLLGAFACGVLLVSGVSLTTPQRLSSGVYGDVNGDGMVDVDDLNEVINVILGLPHDGTNGTRTFTVNGVTFTMVTVEGGTFTMGATAEQGDDAYDEEHPAHQVTLSGYSIGSTEVTQELWLAVMGSNPSWFHGVRMDYDYSAKEEREVDYGNDLQRPVDCVTWDNCQEFIAKLNQLTGEHFRLPTEAEWEFAARGGNKSKGYKYAGSNTLDEVAWYEDNAEMVGLGNSDYGTHAVGTKSPNELGLYDMSGNVWKWVNDCRNPYSSEAQTNPTGPATGAQRVQRGGAYHSDPVSCRVSMREWNFPEDQGYDLGLRLAL